jgi:hypothetical protein
VSVQGGDGSGDRVVVAFAAVLGVVRLTEVADELVVSTPFPDFLQS